MRFALVVKRSEWLVSYTTIILTVKTFEQLTSDQLYDILKLRCDVFIVEQTCYYPDIDDLDRHAQAQHIFAYNDKQLLCYMRLFAPDVCYKNMTSLGRVVTHPIYRGSGLGHTLLSKGLNFLDHHWPEHVCHISAQQHLQAYYIKQGFHAVGEGYLEDDIPHVGMERLTSKPKNNNK